ncbi:MAG: hypothetical protein RLZZ292_1278 [Bacteroidota bacterium]|jgi:hypothetical protein
MLINSEPQSNKENKERDVKIEHKRTRSIIIFLFHKKFITDFIPFVPLWFNDIMCFLKKISRFFFVNAKVIFFCLFSKMPYYFISKMPLPLLLMRRVLLPLARVRYFLK